jgi:hypothetical protein
MRKDVDDLWAEDNGARAQFVQFDVGVVATEGNGTKGGVGVVVGAFRVPLTPGGSR